MSDDTETSGTERSLEKKKLKNTKKIRKFKNSKKWERGTPENKTEALGCFEPVQACRPQAPWTSSRALFQCRTFSHQLQADLDWVR